MKKDLRKSDREIEGKKKKNVRNRDKKKNKKNFKNSYYLHSRSGPGGTLSYYRHNLGVGDALFTDGQKKIDGNNAFSARMYKS